MHCMQTECFVKSPCGADRFVHLQSENAYRKMTTENATHWTLLGKLSVQIELFWELSVAHGFLSETWRIRHFLWKFEIATADTHVFTTGCKYT